MTYREVWEQTEGKDQRERSTKAKKVLDQFFETPNIAVEPYRELTELLRCLLNENGKELAKLFSLLEANDFGEIELLRIALSNLKRPFTRERKEKIERLPNIRQVRYQPVEEKFSLETSTGEIFYAEDTTTYLKKRGRLDLMSLIDPIYCTRNCHLVAYEAMLDLDLEAHTARCCTSFQKRVFHSYSYDVKRDLCIDFAHQFVLKRSDYVSIFQPDLFGITTKEKVECAYREAVAEEEVSTPFPNKLLVISLANGKRKLGGKYGI